jgi:mono/diheme cytochrome c family protein
VRADRLEGARNSALSHFDFWLTLRRLSCYLIAPLLFGMLLAAGGGFGQEKPADSAGQQPNTNQIWIPQLNPADHCITCHRGSAQPTVPHHTKDWGCTVCHRGEGAAAEKEEAHQPKATQVQPLLPSGYIQASCGICHRDDLPDAPQLSHGRQLLSGLGCVGCHRLEGIERPDMIGPDLTDIGTKVSPEWIYKWLKEPRTIVDDSGNTVVNGCAVQPRMPQFPLSEQELRDLSFYLSSLHSKQVEPYQFDPKVVAALEKSSDLAEQGEARFRQMFCTTCHALALTRAGETKLIGGDIGPELTKVGSKVNPDWLVGWLRNPQAYLPKSAMPRYEWSDQDLYVVTRYIRTKLSDPDLLSGVPKLGAPSPEEIRYGRRLFLKKGCGSCHAVQGVKLQEDFGPDLSHLGAESVSHLHFGTSTIPRNVIDYIRGKTSDPASLNPASEMPLYRFDSAELDALTTALLSMTGISSNNRMDRLIVPRAQTGFHPAGAFAQVYERYKCYVCHQFNGYGGTLAPDLSYEGSRAQRQWMIDFLKNPQTLRPTLILRMPQFNMTDQEASILAEYMGVALQNPSVKPSSVDPKQFTPQMAALGKQLYEVKYQCQACHTVGAAGGYVGPDLSNVGNWMTAAWVEAWLRDPLALVPGSIEPRRSMAEVEIEALTAYLMTLRQSAPTAQAATTGARQ